MTVTADFVVSGQRSVYLLSPLNDAAQQHLDEVCPAGPDHIYLGLAVGVDHRYIRGFVDALRDDGFAVE